MTLQPPQGDDGSPSLAQPHPPLSSRPPRPASSVPPTEPASTSTPSSETTTPAPGASSPAPEPEKPPAPELVGSTAEEQLEDGEPDAAELRRRRLQKLESPVAH